MLQTTSYNFIGTSTSEKCVGVVKAAPLHKDPTLHFSDLIMLYSKEYLRPVFQSKDIDCITVDGLATN